MSPAASAASTARSRSTRLPRLVAIGDLLLDVVVVPEQPIEPGTDVPGELSFRRGGSAANTAAAFALAGGRATLITSLGSDALASRLVASLRADGVAVRAARQPGPSGRLAALVDARGERSFVTQRLAADGLRPDDVRSAWLRGADVLHVPAYSLLSEPVGGAALHAAGLAREQGAAVSADLSSAGPLRSYGIRRSRARLRELAPDVLFANRDEAAALSGRAGRRAWLSLLAWAPLVVVKDGVWGCRVLWQEASVEPGRHDRHVLQLDVAAERSGRPDTTGAGDAFAAGFLHSLARSGRASGTLRAGTSPARAGALRRAALAGHRSAARALRRGRPHVAIG